MYRYYTNTHIQYSTHTMLCPPVMQAVLQNVSGDTSRLRVTRCLVDLHATVACMCPAAAAAAQVEVAAKLARLLLKEATGRLVLSPVRVPCQSLRPLQGRPGSPQWPRLPPVFSHPLSLLEPFLSRVCDADTRIGNRSRTPDLD